MGACGGSTAPCGSGSLSFWKAIQYYGTDRLYQSYSIFTDSATTGGTGTNYWVDLKYGSKRLCAITTLDYMPTGNYVLTANYYLDSSFNQLSATERNKEKIDLLLINTGSLDPNGVVINYLNFTGTTQQAGSINQVTISFTLSSAIFNYHVAICDGGDNNFGIKISKVYLKLTCSAGLVKIALKDGTEMCVASTEAEKYVNCYSYERVASTTNYQCYDCAPSGSSNPAK